MGSVARRVSLSRDQAGEATVGERDAKGRQEVGDEEENNLMERNKQRNVSVTDIRPDKHDPSEKWLGLHQATASGRQGGQS